MGTWQGYKCFGLNYTMLVIESLDADTETRRLSPVAVLGDGFVDLINGTTTSPSNQVVEKEEDGVIVPEVLCLCVQALRITAGVLATPVRRGCLCSTASWPPAAPSTSSSAASVLRNFASCCSTPIHLRSAQCGRARLFTRLLAGGLKLKAPFSPAERLGVGLLLQASAAGCVCCQQSGCSD